MNISKIEIRRKENRKKHESIELKQMRETDFKKKRKRQKLIDKRAFKAKEEVKTIEREFMSISYCSKAFYNSMEWKQLRYRILKIRGNRCECCGVGPENGIIQVDHIRPRSIYPELAFEPSNLQVLCKMCNEGKSNTDKTDWRVKTILRKREEA
jgi:5-methylcytosine-specific restriction endonuclease McrA